MTWVSLWENFKVYQAQSERNIWLVRIEKLGIVVKLAACCPLPIIDVPLHSFHKCKKDTPIFSGASYTDHLCRGLKFWSYSEIHKPKVWLCVSVSICVCVCVHSIFSLSISLIETCFHGSASVFELVFHFLWNCCIIWWFHF